MKLLEYKQFNNSDEEKTLNKKKVAIVSVTSFVIILLVVLCMLYVKNVGFRNFMDKYILFKHVDETDMPYISLEQDENVYTCAFYNYVVVLKNNQLTMYNSSGKEVESFKVNINSPVFSVKDNYLVVGEKNQQKCYLFKDKKMVWEKDIEGQISRLSVNQNGYVTTIVSGTSYKSVITTYSEDGSEIFKTYLSNTFAIDSSVSKDNKFMSFCEVDMSGALIEFKVKTISIDKAKQDPANAIIYTYQIPSNVIVTDIEYHNKDELICLCDKSVYSLKNGSLDLLNQFNDGNISFAGANLDKSYFKVSEKTFGINNQQSSVDIFNTSNGNVSNYMISGIAKDVDSKNGVIAVNLGNEVYFIGENGWLIKKYTSSQEIKDVVVSNNVAGIIYRNKITFISL